MAIDLCDRLRSSGLCSLAPHNSQAEEYRKKRDIRAITKDMPNPVRTFDEASFPEYVLAEVLKAGFKEPSAIQSQGWPLALTGRDVVGISRTGSGKTLAFLLPGVVHINAQPYLQRGDGPIVLVIAPTRELACQIKVECDKFGCTSKIKNSERSRNTPRALRGPEIAHQLAMSLRHICRHHNC